MIKIKAILSAIKAILSAVARTFGISSPEDLRKQKRVASKMTVSNVNSNNQQSRVRSETSSEDQFTEPAQRYKKEPF